MIDKSVLETILQTCNKIEIPPNPSKKLVKIILIEISLIAMLEIKEIPLVISKKPVKRGVIKLVLILNGCNKIT